MRIAIAWALAAVSLSQALVGDWTSYTNLETVRDLEGVKGNLFAATTGGIRRIDAKGAEKVYRNTEGLRDVGIRALASGPDGEVYATSELGYVYHYRYGADDWEILGTSYRSAGWKMNKRALLYRAGYLVLGSEKGLSFFNVAKKVADANVTKMEAATSLSVNSVLFVGDTLFAGTNHGIFRAVLHMDKLLNDPQINIFNPGIWSNVPGTDGPLFFDPAPDHEDTGYVRDSLAEAAEIVATRPADVGDAGLYAHGLLYYGASGIGSDYAGASYPDRDARVSPYGEIRMDGKKLPGSYRWEAIAKVGDKWFLGGQDLYAFDPAKMVFTLMRNPENLPQVQMTAVKANRLGTFIFATPNVYRLNGKIWAPIESVNVVNSPNDSRRRGQHAFEAPAPNQYYLGTWGFGFYTFRDGKAKVFDASNSCLVTSDGGNPNYPVVWSETPYKDKGIFIVNWAHGHGYQFGYYDFAKESLACFDPAFKDLEPRNLQVVGDNVLAVVTENGVEAYRIDDNGVSLTIEPQNLLAGLAASVENPLAGKADRFGNFWVTTEGTHLLYIPSVTFKSDLVQSYKTLDGFDGSSCMNLESDPQGHLWAGCTEGGVFEIIPGKDTLSHSFRHYGLNDGLLSETIFDLEVNQENGEVWIATEKGLARYESTSRPTRANLSTLKVYPNPFLARHTNVVFANLSPGSEVQVTTQSGSVIFHRSLATGTGDQIRWDGRNQAGERVREGVYFYVVRSPKETKNGKIIVAR